MLRMLVTPNCRVKPIAPIETIAAVTRPKPIDWTMSDQLTTAQDGADTIAGGAHSALLDAGIPCMQLRPLLDRRSDREHPCARSAAAFASERPSLVDG